MSTYKLPGTSYSEIAKLIQAYGTKKANIPMSLEELSKASSMDRSQISRNNGFLLEIALINKGVNKSPTESCVQLSKAYSINMSSEITKCWKNIIDESEFFQKILQTLHINKKMKKQDYINHIIYVCGESVNNNKKAGAGAVVEILKVANVIEEENDLIYIKKSNVDNTPDNKVSNISSVNNVTTVPLPIKPIEIQTSIFNQDYTCESGDKISISIPNSASKEDLLAFYEMFTIILKRRYKISEDNFI